MIVTLMLGCYRAQTGNQCMNPHCTCGRRPAVGWGLTERAAKVAAVLAAIGRRPRGITGRMRPKQGSK